jgi:hypothetical protein
LDLLIRVVVAVELTLGLEKERLSALLRVGKANAKRIHTIWTSPTTLAHEYRSLTHAGERYFSTADFLDQQMLRLDDCAFSWSFVPHADDIASNSKRSTFASLW